MENTDPQLAYANRVIDLLGGTSKLATLIAAPTSTVHSWRAKVGIPASRLAHLRLLAKEQGVELPDPPSENEAAKAA